MNGKMWADFSKKKLQKICFDFATLLETCVAVYDLENNLIIHSNRQSACSHFHNIKNSNVSDTNLKKQVKGTEKHHLNQYVNGLFEIEVPVFLETNYLGNLITGTFFTVKPDLNNPDTFAKQFGMDKNEYLSFVKKIPVYSTEHIKKTTRFLEILASIIGNIVYKDALLAEKNEELKNTKKKEIELSKKTDQITEEYETVIEELRQSNEELYTSQEELIRTTKKLEQSEKHLQNIINNIGDPVFVKDNNSRLIHVNESFCKLFGQKKEDILGKTLAEEVSPEERESFLKIDKEVLKTGKENINEETLTLKGKETSIISTRKTRFTDENGNKFLVGVIHDITAIKLAEKKLQETEKKLTNSVQRFKLAMQASKDGLFDWNLVTNEIYYSPGWKKMLGYDDHELPNNFAVWKRLTKKEDETKSWDMQKELINKKRDRFEMEFKMKHKKGHWVDILSRAEAIFDENGKAVRIVGTHVDISERKKAALRLKEAEENLQNTFDISPIIIANADIEKGYFTQVYKAVTRLLGYSTREFTSKPIMDFIHPDDRQKTAEEISLQLNGLATFSFENRYLCKNGTYKWISWQVTPPNEKGIVIAVGSDIDNRKKAEKELIQYKDSLEKLVKERTSELTLKNKELEDFNHLFVGREFRIKELKDKVKELENKLRDRE